MIDKMNMKNATFSTDSNAASYAPSLDLNTKSRWRVKRRAIRSKNEACEPTSD